MSTLHSYAFNNMANLGADMTDQTQNNIQNTKFGTYSVSNYFSQSTDSQIQFACQQPGINVHNMGMSPSVIDNESALFNKSEQERADEKLQLFQRPFSTVPYLGRGGGDPSIETMLWAGEPTHGMKSVNTVTELPYIDYNTYPMQQGLQAQIANPSNYVEELALNGWVRGGSDSRNMGPSKEAFQPKVGF